MRKRIAATTMLLVAIFVVLAITGLAGEQKCEGKRTGATEDSCIVEMVPMVTSYYGAQFHGRYTASGEVFDQYAMTCAHKTLPFGTKLWVLNPESGSGVLLTVNDRGPFIKGRDLDVSYGAAIKLNMIKQGVIRTQTIKER